MKPALNDIIYIIFRDSITKTSVYMLGETSFAHSEAFNHLMLDAYRDPLDYNDYNKTWFTSLSKAKEVLLKDNPDCKVVRVGTGYWELEFKE